MQQAKERTRITVIHGAAINGKYQTKTEPGSVALHTDAFLCAGWRVHTTCPNGSVLVEKDGSLYRVGEPYVEEKEQATFLEKLAA